MTAESDNIRLIKKYPNRRLYDTQESCYITLDEVRQMVIQNAPFKVIDQKTGEDLTRSILLQIILEQENAGDPLFNSDVLSQFIRNYSDTSRDNFSSFLQASMQMFAEQQASLVDQLDKALEGSPFDLWTKMSKQNMDHFQKLQRNFFNASQTEKNGK
ncbi:MAG: polyhydroxyalkanoate synthesis repressor PhaR [Gammaproteobacteria bacterium]|nr:polyhydroxyalkanoate synthesis repressor PhaR [Gammaproteobacteria bacterium]MBL6999576.1 polyhydroxyalkanoate synthesis repressor PhaR [Gammaproteobacteria bacterium]